MTHYFSINKARREIGYSPINYDLQGVVRYFKERGHGRKVQYKQSSISYALVNVTIAIIFTLIMLSWIPGVKIL